MQFAGVKPDPLPQSDQPPAARSARPRRRTAVVLEYRPDDLLITVTDDGRPATEPGGPGRRGLIGLRERIGIYGGELDAGPRPGGGWRVRARIPLEGLGVSARLGGPGEGGEPAGPVRPEFLASPR